MRFARPAYMVMVYLFLYIPIAMLMILSFNDSHFSALWHGFTWRWYQTLLSDTHLIEATWHSLLLAITVATISVSLGTLASISLRRHQFKGRGILQSGLYLLILAPDIVLGIALLILFSSSRIPFGFLTLLISHVTFCMPFAVFTIYSRLATLDDHLFEAAIDLGATEWMLLGRVLLPLLWPAIFAAYLLCFTLSFDDVIISYFVSGPSFSILPLNIYSMVHADVDPRVNALCSIILVFTLGLVVMSQFLLRRKQ